MITPAISVLGAVEGLEVATPLFRPYVVPMTVVILVGLFLIQKFGTHRVGGLFGPIMIIWFVTMAASESCGSCATAGGLGRLRSSSRALRSLRRTALSDFAVLGAVFLVVTGGEALYADMGHFGRIPIRLAWFALVLPALVLNYLGQGALLLLDPSVEHPFFLLAPSWALLPLVGLSTAAAIIASQALISGSFSITRQAIQLGLAPRLEVEHTSAREMGQIYVPQVNWALMFATLIIVVGFGSSTALAAAYGIAVTLTMVITVLLLYVVMTERWRWPKPAAMAIMLLFLIIDLAFFGANALKILQGGWVTLGRRAAAVHIDDDVEDRPSAGRRTADGARDPAPGLHCHRRVDATGASARHCGVHDGATEGHAAGAGAQSPLQQGAARARVVLTVSTAQQPHVLPEERVSVEALGHDLFNVRVQYGFMEDPDVPEALQQARAAGTDARSRRPDVLPGP